MIIVITVNAEPCTYFKFIIGYYFDNLGEGARLELGAKAKSVLSILMLK